MLKASFYCLYRRYDELQERSEEVDAECSPFVATRIVCEAGGRLGNARPAFGHDERGNWHQCKRVGDARPCASSERGAFADLHKGRVQEVRILLLSSGT